MTRRAGKSDGGLMRLYMPSGETPAGKAQRSVGAAEEAIVARKEEYLLAESAD
jgi:hypothetical protein